MRWWRCCEAHVQIELCMNWPMVVLLNSDGATDIDSRRGRSDSRVTRADGRGAAGDPGQRNCNRGRSSEDGGSRGNGGDAHSA